MKRVAVPVARSVPTGTTNSYLVGTDRALLVDPPTRHADLDALVAEHEVEHVAVTHTHPDHVGGVAPYARETGATVWARRSHTDEFEAVTGVTPDATMVDGTTIDTDAGPVTVLDTPGHAHDHVAFEFGEGILCGDLAVAEGSVVVGAPEGDMRAYLTSLRRLRARAPARLFPGHGPTIDGPRATLDRLIDHRLARETRVVQAVQAGASHLDDVVDAAYDKDVSAVHGLAVATVRAHLEKLAVEGKVRWDPVGERAGVNDDV